MVYKWKFVIRVNAPPYQKRLSISKLILKQINKHGSSLTITFVMIIKYMHRYINKHNKALLSVKIEIVSYVFLLSSTIFA